jgi:hypothetical protein
MTSKPGVDLGGTFLETFKTSPGGSLTEQLETFRFLTDKLAKIKQEPLPTITQDWEKLLSEAANRAVESFAPASPAASGDPMIGLLTALVHASEPLAVGDLLKPTGLDVTRLMDLVGKAEDFSFIARTGTPPRFSITPEGISVFKQATAK